MAVVYEGRDPREGSDIRPGSLALCHTPTRAAEMQTEKNAKKCHDDGHRGNRTTSMHLLTGSSHGRLLIDRSEGRVREAPPGPND